MLLQIRLPWYKLIHKGARNINSSYMDNEDKRITCTSMEQTNSRQFIIVITIIIPISVVHFPNELNQNSSQYHNWSCNYKLPQFSLLSAFHTKLLEFSPTKPTTISRLCQNLFCVPLLLYLSKSFGPSLSLSLSLCVTSVYTLPKRSYLKQTNLNLLSKHCNLHLKSFKFCRRALFAMQTTNIKLCSVIQLLPTIVQLSPFLIYLKYTTFGLLCKQFHSTLSHICT